jgi:predicted DNA-binding protein
METESVRINKELMNRLRKYLARKTEGRMYGEIGTTIEEAIKEYLDKMESKTND